jgi:hypothetical protein
MQLRREVRYVEHPIGAGRNCVESPPGEAAGVRPQSALILSGAKKDLVAAALEIQERFKGRAHRCTFCNMYVALTYIIRIKGIVRIFEQGGETIGSFDALDAQQVFLFPF